MVAKIDRTGERNINNFGSEMKIIEYRKYNDIFQSITGLPKVWLIKILKKVT